MLYVTSAFDAGQKAGVSRIAAVFHLPHDNVISTKPDTDALVVMPSRVGRRRFWISVNKDLQRS